jgi:hypothetical protein
MTSGFYLIHPIILSFPGQEKQDFWDAIGGRETYASEKRLIEEHLDQPARLFQCSNASGRFKGTLDTNSTSNSKDSLFESCLDPILSLMFSQSS